MQVPWAETEGLTGRQRQLDIQTPVSRRTRKEEGKSRGEKWEYLREFNLQARKGEGG